VSQSKAKTTCTGKTGWSCGSKSWEERDGKKEGEVSEEREDRGEEK
jgi:hypothetical protein